MGKDKFHKALLKTAKNFADLSHCKRLKVGAVIARDGRPLVTGYNGNLAGTDNCCEEIIGTELYCSRCGCEDQDKLDIGLSGDRFENVCGSCNYSAVVKSRDITKTKSSVIHAERNSVYYATRFGINTDGCDMYITHAPCVECAQAIVAVGIKRVFYSNEYRNDDGTLYLRKNGIKVQCLNINN